MMTMKLLIATWGNPKGWEELVYEFEGKEVKSYTSLKILHEVIAPNKTIIIGLDTLAEEGSNYEEVKKNAEERINEYASKFGLKNYEILIAPGIGSFPHGTFCGSALDYYYYILAKISTNLLNYSDNVLEIHLDLTHGINYSTILTYKAIKEILELFSIFEEIKFKAYNADPSLPFATNKLFMNIIEDISPTPKPFDGKIKQKRLLDPIDLNPEERKKLFEKDLRCIKELDASEISAFLGALYNGLPLALFRFYPDKNNLKKTIFKTLEVYEKYIKIEHTTKLNVKRKVRFGEDFKAYIFTYLTTNLLEKLGLVSSQEREVELLKVKYITSNLFKFDKRLKIKIENDIYTLEKDIKDKNVSNWEIYNNILGKPIGEPDKRNFLAHSGFERNLVEIKKTENAYVRYRENKIKIIKDFCQQGLK